jgi:putative photosynthetic complex assembly protein
MGIELSSLDERPFPKAAIVGASLLIFATVAGVAAGQLHKHFVLAAPAITAKALQSRDLRFVDAGDGVNAFGGHVRVYDVATGAELPPLVHSDGFIRAVLNSLAFERTKRGVSAAPIFQLALWSGNKLTLGDKTTGAEVNLGAFGSGNRAVFLRFLDHSGAKS